MTRLPTMVDVRTLAFTRSRTVLAALCFTALLTATRTLAQEHTNNNGHTVDVALSYATARAVNTSTEASFWMQGGALEADVRLYRGLGVAASAAGLHSFNNDPQTLGLDMVTLTFGPRYIYLVRPRMSVFGEALVGEARGFNSLFAYPGQPSNPANSSTTSSNALAIQAGGGIDFSLKRHFSARIVQVDLLRTQLPNGGTDVQNNIRISTGIDYRFGR